MSAKGLSPSLRVNPIKSDRADGKRRHHLAMSARGHYFKNILRGDQPHE
jgi:hypothetical protein